MATENILQTITLPAAADYSSTGQYLFVGVDSSGQAAVIASQGADAIGVLQNDPAAAGRAASVAVGGVTKVLCGEDSLAAGVKVTPGADGRAETAATGDFVVGWTLVGGDDGEVISILLTHQDVSA